MCSISCQSILRTLKHSLQFISAFKERVSHPSTFSGLLNSLLSDFSGKAYHLFLITFSFLKPSSNSSVPFPCIVQAKGQFAGVCLYLGSTAELSMPTRAPCSAVAMSILFVIIASCLGLVTTKAHDTLYFCRRLIKISHLIAKLEA